MIARTFFTFSLVSLYLVDVMMKSLWADRQVMKYSTDPNDRNKTLNWIFMSVLHNICGLKSASVNTIELGSPKKIKCRK